MLMLHLQNKLNAGRDCYGRARRHRLCRFWEEVTDADEYVARKTPIKPINLLSLPLTRVDRNAGDIYDFYILAWVNLYQSSVHGIGTR